MLGREQLAWLKRRMAASDATWKIIATSVPLSVGWNKANADGWASGKWRAEAGGQYGFEWEMWGILESIASLPVSRRRVVFLSADVHFAAALIYRPFMNHSSAHMRSFSFHEIITGPLNSKISHFTGNFDETFNPTLLYYLVPATCRGMVFNASNCAETGDLYWEEAKEYFNFGKIEIDERGELSAKIISAEKGEMFNVNVI